MKSVIVLAMHGAPPKDVPQRQVIELVGLHESLERAPVFVRWLLGRHHAALDAKIRAWPRNPQNDPFWAGSHELAEHLRMATGSEVIVGFNEFCAPALDDALDEAAARGDKVIVVTPMVTRGGEHSEVEIPAAVRRAQERHPTASFAYVWPLDVSAVARFLAAQMDLGGL